MTPQSLASNHAIHPKRIFFSYGHDQNRPIVERLKHDLEARGHVVWIDYDRIGTWDDWRGRITEGIQESEMAVAFLSVHSVRKPGVCRNEIAMALQRFGRVYPLLVEKLDGTEDLPITLEHLQWPDLSEWRDLHGDIARQEAFERYYMIRLAEVIEKIEGDATRFSDEMRFLERALVPLSFDGRFQQHLDGFIGRRWLISEFDNWIRNKTASKLFWLSAGPGFGKTAWAVNVAAGNPSMVVGKWFCQQGSRDCSDPARALTTIAFQFAQKLDDYRSRLISSFAKLVHVRGFLASEGTAVNGDLCDEVEGAKDGGCDAWSGGLGGGAYSDEALLLDQSREGLFHWASDLARTKLASKTLGDLYDFLFTEPMSGVIPRGHRHAFLIDALDEAGEPGGLNPLAELLDNRLMHLPEWMCAIVTSRPEPAVIDRLGRHSPLEIKADDPRNVGDLQEFAGHLVKIIPAQPGEQAGKRLQLIETLVRKSEGMMLYLQRIAEGLANGSLHPAQIDTLASGISGLESNYLSEFERRFVEGYLGHIQPLLRLLLAAPADPTEEFCAAVLGDRERVRRARLTLGSYVVKESGRLRIYHKTLSDWLIGERSSVYFTDPVKGRAQIAEFLWKCFTERDKDSPDQRIHIKWEGEVLAWLPSMLPSLPQWRNAVDLQAFGEFLNLRKQYPASLEVCGRAYRMRKREKGEADMTTLRAGRAYGIALKESGAHDEAERLLRFILLHRTNQKNGKPNLTHVAMEDLAAVLFAKKAFAECIDLRRNLHEQLTRASHCDSGKLQAALFRLGDAESAAGEYAQALATFMKLLKIREAEFGFADPGTLVVASRLAATQRSTGDLDAARVLAMRTVKTMQESFPASDRRLLSSRSMLGDIEERLGNLESAEEQYRLALSGSQATSPQGDGTILVMYRLGGILLKRNAPHEACEMLEYAWRLRGGIKSLDDTFGLDILDRLTCAMNAAGARAEAVELMRNFLQFFENGSHTLLYNIACYECLEGNHAIARSHIAAFLAKMPAWRDRALADPDLNAIREYIQSLEAADKPFASKS